MRLLRIVENADMRCSQPGLLELLEKTEMSIKATDYRAKEDIVAVVFLNAKKNRMKVLSFQRYSEGLPVMAYYVSPHGRVPPEAIRFISEAFGGSGFDMTAAIKKGLETILGRKDANGKA